MGTVHPGGEPASPHFNFLSLLCPNLPLPPLSSGCSLYTVCQPPLPFPFLPHPLCPLHRPFLSSTLASVYVSSLSPLPFSFLSLLSHPPQPFGNGQPRLCAMCPDGGRCPSLVRGGLNPRHPHGGRSVEGGHILRGRPGGRGEWVSRARLTQELGKGLGTEGGSCLQE